MRDHFYLNGSHKLFACKHSMPNASATPKIGIVLCNTIHDEHIACYRILFELADKLASLGIPTIRFDLPGHGDSFGKFEDATPTSILNACKTAANCLQEQTGATRVGFLGVRLSAALALQSAQLSKNSFAVLWEPVDNAKTHFKGLIRRAAVAATMYGETKIRLSADSMINSLCESNTYEVDLGGYVLTSAMYDAYINARQPDATIRRGTTKLTIRSNPDSDNINDDVEGTGMYQHIHTPPFWVFPDEGSKPLISESWFNTTVDWVKKL